MGGWVACFKFEQESSKHNLAKQCSGTTCIPSPLSVSSKLQMKKLNPLAPSIGPATRLFAQPMTQRINRQND